MMERPCILYTTPIVGFPPIGGPELRVANSIRALSAVARLHVYLLENSEESINKSTREFLSLHSASLCFVPTVRKSLRGLNYLCRKVFGTAWLDVCSGSDFRHRGVVDAARGLSVDAIWLGFGNITYPLLQYIKKNSSFPTVVDTDSVWSRFVARGTEFASTPEERERIAVEASNKACEESLGTRVAEVTTAVSETDAQYYRQFVSNPNRVRVFSNVVDVPSYVASSSRPHDLLHPSIFVAGSFWPRSPMDDAARWMIGEVLPLLNRRHKSVQLVVAGRGSAQVLRDISVPNVLIKGEIPSVLPYLAHADVIAVPLRYESGTRFKIMEAGACRRPVVSTRLGAEGLAVVHGRDILLADTPSDFANAIAGILEKPELAVAMSTNLRDYVAAHCGLQTAQQQAHDHLRYLGLAPRHQSSLP